MSNKLLKEGYLLLAGGRDLVRIQREYKTAAFKFYAQAPGDFTPGRNDDKTEGYEPGSVIINQEGSVFRCIDSTQGKAQWVQTASAADITEQSFVDESLQEVIDEIPDTLTGEGTETKDETSDPKTDGSEDEDPKEGSGDETSDPKEPSDGDQSDEKEEEEETEDSNSASKEPKSEKPKEKQAKKDDSKRNSPDILQTDSGPNKGKTPLPEDIPWHSYLTEKNGIETIEEVQRRVDEKSLTDLKYINRERADQIREWLVAGN